jgi:hypothetical protein
MENLIDRITKQKIETITDAINISRPFIDNYVFFRGHSECFGNLRPKLFRNTDTLHYANGGLITDNVQKLLWIHSQERNYLEDFERIAPAYYPNLPNNENQILWLLLAQHYGLPTRLLDWTENILVALYFASLQEEEDGELWSLQPNALNFKSGISDGILSINCFQVKNLANAAINSNPYSETNYQKPGLNCNPVAFLPPAVNPRIISQSSAFTIHPLSDIESNGIINLLDTKDDMAHQSLCRYKVPKECKNEIRENLRAIGITERFLFQDLDSLSRNINKMYGIRKPGEPE